MADTKNFGKVLQRTVTRTKEKVLRNLGKTDITIDDHFEEHHRNFLSQQSAALKFQKEIKKYQNSVRDMVAARDSMYKTVKELYEPSWLGFMDFNVVIQELSPSLENLHENISENLVKPFNAYVNQFTDLKAKVNKRNRKLMDYDYARHHHECLAAKKARDVKAIQTAAEELDKAQKVYDDINTELNKELSEFYNHRVFVTATAFKALINADVSYFDNAGKCCLKMSLPIQTLLDDSKTYASTSPTRTSGQFSPPPKPPQPFCKLSKQDEEESFIHKEYNLTEITSNTSSKKKESLANSNRSSSAAVDFTKDNDDNEDVGGESDLVVHHHDGDGGRDDEVIVNDDVECIKNDNGKPAMINNDGSKIAEASDNNDVNYNGQYEICSPSNIISAKSEEIGKVDDHDHSLLDGPEMKTETINGTASDSDSPMKHSTSEDIDVDISKASLLLTAGITLSPSTATSTSSSITDTTIAAAAATAEVPKEENVCKISTFVPPERILFKVQATHKYVGEDTDELSFDIGDVIIVVPYDNPDEQDEGWQMGITEKTKIKGVFPQNFTKIIE